jgi:hypothetical protein
VSTVVRTADLSSSTVRGSRVAIIGALTVISALIANLIVYAIGDALVGYDSDFVVLATPGGTIIFTLFFGTLAVLVYAAVLRLSRNPVRHFTWISAVALIVSIIPDLTYIPGVEGASNGQTAVLIVMHVVAAAVIVAMLTKLAGPRQN